MSGRGIRRVVAVGASNLTRGFHAVVATARGMWGPDVEVVGALGHGRLYGGPSRYLGRRLPGILESGLWQALDERPPAATRALLTDVGNDIMWDCPPSGILEWVDLCVARLQRHTILPVTYEALRDQWQPTVDGVLRFLGVEPMPLDPCATQNETRPLHEVISNYHELGEGA